MMAAEVGGGAAAAAERVRHRHRSVLSRAAPGGQSGPRTARRYHRRHAPLAAVGLSPPAAAGGGMSPSTIPAAAAPPPAHAGAGAAAAAEPRPAVTLNYLENMVAGGLSRAAAQAACHPLNVCKTLLQSRGAGSVGSLAELARVIAKDPMLLTRGLIEQALLSVPNGAVNFATLEVAKASLMATTPSALAARFEPALDLVASTCGTLLSSVISVPQTVLLDRTMTGQYPSFLQGAKQLAKAEGVRGFYRGWTPSMGSKIPSYALTWASFQAFKGLYRRQAPWMLTEGDGCGVAPNGAGGGQKGGGPGASAMAGPSTVGMGVCVPRETNNWENFGLGALASAVTVCLMIPMDTVKTRLTTQTVMAGGVAKYAGIADCFAKIWRDEGAVALYRALPPRLLSVVPMMGIQLCVYELARTKLTERKLARQLDHAAQPDPQRQPTDPAAPAAKAALMAAGEASETCEAVDTAVAAAAA